MGRFGDETHAAAAAVALVLLWAYWPLVAGIVDGGEWEFVSEWDDDGNYCLPTSEHSRPCIFTPPYDWGFFVRVFTGSRINVYEPFGNVLKALVYAAFGNSPIAVRLTSLGLHALAAIVLMLWVRHLLQLRRGGGVRVCDTWASAAGAAVYMAHPVHAEVIGWPSAQPYALTAVFGNLSMLFYLRNYWPVDFSERPNARNPCFSPLMCYIAAVMSKSAALPLPAAFVAVDFYLLRGLGRESKPAAVVAPRAASKSIKPPRNQWPSARGLVKYASIKMPFAVVAVAMVAVTFAANYEDGMEATADTIAFALWPYRAVKACRMVAFLLLHQVLWPANLRAHYKVDEVALSWSLDPSVKLSVAAVAGLTLFVACKGRERRWAWLAACWCYFLAMLLPVCGLIQHGFVILSGDRYGYLSSVFFAPLVAARIASCVEPLPQEITPEQRAPRLINASPGAPDATLRRRLPRNRDAAGANGNGGAAPGLAKVAAPKVRRHAVHQNIAANGFKFPGAIVMATLALLSALTQAQVQVWRSNLVMLHHAILADPADWRMLDTLAEFHLKNQNPTAAAPYYPRALQHLPRTASGRPSLKLGLLHAKLLFFQGKTGEACRSYYDMYRDGDYLPHALLYNNVAMCLLRDKRDEDAAEMFRQALVAGKAPAERMKKILDNSQKLQVWNRDSGEDYRGSLVW